MHPDLEADQHGRHRSQRHGRIADQGAAAEGRHGIGDDPHGRQHDDIDPRVGEDPEQVLPQKRLSAFRHVEEMGADIAVHPQQEEGEADRRHHHQVGDRSGEGAPDQDRHVIDRHAGRSHAEQGDDEVGGADRGGNAQQHHAQRIDVDIGPRIEMLTRQRHVVEPSGVRRLAQREAGIEKQASEQEEPEAKRVQPRKGHVARAQHQGPQIVREAGQDRRSVEEDHRHAVHGEDLVVLLRRQQVHVRCGQLSAQDQRLDTADQQEDEGQHDVANADLLVVDAG